MGAAQPDAVRVGVVGAGLMGSTAARILRALPDAKLAGIAALELEHATPLAQAMGVPAVEWAAMLADDSVDAVAIATPTDTHVPLARAALKRGKHVFVEKPMARELEEARALAADAAKSGRVLAVGHVIRYFAEYAALKDAIDAGRVGQVGVATLGRRVARPDWTADGWYAQSSRSGGAALDMLLHDIDVARWLFGEPMRGHCRLVGPDEHDGLDYVLATLRFTGGELCHLHASWAEPEGFSMVAEVCGSSGMLTYDSRTVGGVSFAAHSGTATTALPDDAGTDPADPYVLQMTEFLGRIQGRDIPVPRLADAAWAQRSLELALALIGAAASRTTVSLGPDDVGRTLGCAIAIPAQVGVRERGGVA